MEVVEWMHEIDCLSREVHLSWMRSYLRSAGRYSHSLFDSCAGFGLIHHVDVTRHRRFHEIEPFCSTLVSKTRLPFQPDLGLIICLASIDQILPCCRVDYTA